jgi:hypothetical protein
MRPHASIDSAALFYTTVSKARETNQNVSFASRAAKVGGVCHVTRTSIGSLMSSDASAGS